MTAQPRRLKPTTALALALGGWVLVSCTGDTPTVRETAASTSQALNLAPKLADFVVYAQRSVTLGSYDHVNGGDVGVRYQVVQGNGSQLVVSAFAHVDEAHNLLAPSVSLGTHCQVGDVQTSALQNDGADALGHVASFPGPAMPFLPLALAPPASGPDVVVASHKTVHLDPGVYGALSLADHSELDLSAGLFSFSSVTLSQHAQIATDASGVAIHVAGAFTTGGWNFINPASGGAADKLVITVQAADPAPGQSAFSLGAHDHITAVVAAPNGTAALADHVLATGAFLGFDVALSDHVQLQFQSGFPASAAGQSGSQQLTGYYGNPTDGSFPLVAPVPPSKVFELDVGLPMKNAPQLKAFIQSVSDPTNANYRQYIKNGDFNATYGADPVDYQTVKTWAQSAGFSVIGTYSNHLLLSVTGTASQISQAIFANVIYRRRVDGSSFLTVDREPSVNLSVPLLWISGLDDYIFPTPAVCPTDPSSLKGATGGGAYWANDLRNAYLGTGSSCQSLDGTGQVIGLVEVTDYRDSDIQQYDKQNPPYSSGITPLTFANVSRVFNGGMVGSPDSECTLDVEMAQAMAPGAQVLVFEGNTGISAHPDSILMDMADRANSLGLTIASNSLFFGRSGDSQQALSEMAALGVSFFSASGDYGNIGDPQDIRNMDNQTLVGGTFLSTNSTAPFYSGERTWNGGCAGKDVTGGGVMDGTPQNSQSTITCFCIPSNLCCGDAVDIPGYQQSVPMGLVGAGGNGGSTTFRNYPDVALVAADVEIFFGGAVPTGGTSAAAPLWAGITALANQLGKSQGVGTVGFANNAIYDIGKTRGLSGGNDLYAATFHDIADGVTNSNTVLGFPSVAGYDLATGWGSPTCALIQQLGTFNPTLPQNFNFLDLHIVNGHDGVNDQSSVTMDVLDKMGNTLHTYTLKQEGEGGWSDLGVIHDFTSLPLFDASGNQTTYSSNTIGKVVVTLLQNGQGGSNADNWDIGGFGLRLATLRAPEGCQLDLSGNGSCDTNVAVCKVESGGTVALPDDQTGIARLSESCCSSGDGATVAFDIARDGCAQQPAHATPSQPFTQMEVILDTGDDDLRSGSELDIHVFSDATTDVADGILKPSGAPKFDNDTEHSIIFQLPNGPLALSQIDHINLSMENSGNDEWHIFGARMYGVSANGQFEPTCLFIGAGATTGGSDAESLDKLGGSHPSTGTFGARSGCN